MFDTDEHEKLMQQYELWMRRKAQAQALGNDAAAQYAEQQADQASRALYQYIWNAMGVKRPLERSR